MVDDLASARPWRPRCVEIRGRAEAIADPPDWPLIRIHAERVVSFGIDENTPAPQLTVNARDIDRGAHP